MDLYSFTRCSQCNWCEEMPDSHFIMCGARYTGELCDSFCKNSYVYQYTDGDECEDEYTYGYMENEFCDKLDNFLKEFIKNNKKGKHSINNIKDYITHFCNVDYIDDYKLVGMLRSRGLNENVINFNEKAYIKKYGSIY